MSPGGSGLPPGGKPPATGGGAEAPPAGQPLELYGGAGCPYTAELREQLLWDGRDFVEHDVESDAAALARLLQLTGGRHSVPVLVEDGRVMQIGWQGRTCTVSGPSAGQPSAGQPSAGQPAAGSESAGGTHGTESAEPGGPPRRLPS